MGEVGTHRTGSEVTQRDHGVSASCSSVPEFSGESQGDFSCLIVSVAAPLRLKENPPQIFKASDQQLLCGTTGAGG